MPFEKWKGRVSSLLPSGLTLLGLCSGATAIRFAFVSEWQWAVGAIFLAMLFDVLDGHCARWLGTNSLLGAQLDTLADIVSFGLAPAITVYAWTLFQLGNVGWAVALVFCIFSALRLARFNTEMIERQHPVESQYGFIGLPTPAAAGLILLPLLLTFALENDFVRGPLACVIFILITSAMMVSRLPTPSWADLQLHRLGFARVSMTLIATCVLVVNFPWTSLALALSIYVATIPIALYYRLAKRGAPSGD